MYNVSLPSWIVSLMFLTMSSGVSAMAAAVKVEEVRVTGAKLVYKPQNVPKNRRTPEGELAIIEKATAQLQIRKPLSYRRQRLAPGEYAVRVVRNEDKKTFSMALEQVAKGKKSKKKGKKSGVAVGDPASNKDKEDSQPASLRARLKLRSTKEVAPKVVFSMRLTQDGTGLLIAIHAGNTIGRSSFRFGGTASGKTEP